jgi:outer membrane protein OmpA-like peptidoglycan-associated protein
MLSTEFGIDAARMETDGMGETKPVGDNKSAEGKAQNRRVEFVKL